MLGQQQKHIEIPLLYVNGFGTTWPGIKYRPHYRYKWLLDIFAPGV